MQDTTARNAIVLVAVVAAGAAFYWLRGILAPLTLALFMVIMIDGVARAIDRHLKFVPTQASLPIAMVLIVAAFLIAVIITVDGFAGFASQLSGLHARANQIIADLAAMANIKVAPTVDQLVDKLDPAKYVGPLALAVQNIGMSALFVLIYLGFLLASRQGFRKKFVTLFPTRDERQEAQNILERIRTGVEGYVWIQTLTGLMITVLCYAVMVGVGLKNAGFWAFLIFLSGYIPIIGAAIPGAAPALFALVQFQTYWQAIVLFVAIQIILAVILNIVLPRLQAKTMNIDAVVVLLGLAFWGALWGVAGAFLSTPLTVMAMAILAEFKSSRWIAVLLSGDGQPYPLEPPEPPAEDLKPVPKPKGRNPK